MGAVKNIVKAMEKAEATLPHILAVDDGSPGSVEHIKWMMKLVMREGRGGFDPHLVKTMLELEYQT